MFLTEFHLHPKYMNSGNLVQPGKQIHKQPDGKYEVLSAWPTYQVYFVTQPLGKHTAEFKLQNQGASVFSCFLSQTNSISSSSTFLPQLFAAHPRDFEYDAENDLHKRNKSKDRSGQPVCYPRWPLPLAAYVRRLLATADNYYYVVENPLRHTLAQTRTYREDTGYPTWNGDSRRWTGNRGTQN